MITKSVVRLTLKIFRAQEGKKRKPRFVIGPKSIVVDGMAFEKKWIGLSANPRMSAESKASCRWRMLYALAAINLNFK